MRASQEILAFVWRDVSLPTSVYWSQIWEAKSWKSPLVTWAVHQLQVQSGISGFVWLVVNSLEEFMQLACMHVSVCPPLSRNKDLSSGQCQPLAQLAGKSEMWAARWLVLEGRGLPSLCGLIPFRVLAPCLKGNMPSTFKRRSWDDCYQGLKLMASVCKSCSIFLSELLD